MSQEVITVPRAGTTQRQLSVQDRKLGDMRGFLAANMKALTSVLPSHMKPERLARIVLTAVQKTPKLLDCTKESFIGCVLSCAALGLEPDGLLGQAYLIPFGKTCTLVPGYKGLLKLAYQSGEISNIDAQAVRIGDAFDYAYGTEPHLEHKPAEAPITLDAKGVMMVDRAWRPGAITHFYAVAIMKDGSKRFRVMPTWEVDEIRDGSQGYQYAIKSNSDNPWITDYSEMGKKTAIRAMTKLLPASIEKPQLQRAIAIDERADRGLAQDLEFVTDIPAISSGDSEDSDQHPEAGQPEGKPTTLSGAAAKSKASRESAKDEPPEPGTTG